MDVTRPTERLVPAAPEEAYDALTSYRFALRFVGGKSVADVVRDAGTGYGSRLLSPAAESVVALTGSPEAAERASSVYPAPNLEYRSADLPKLPHEADRFDVVLAFGTLADLEEPEVLVSEARRVLRPDGVFLVSVPDRRSPGGADPRGMYDTELRELLERRFDEVRLYRQGAVSGGLVYRDGGDEDGGDVRVGSARFSVTDPAFGAGLPALPHLLAVCAKGDVPAEEEGPFLLLDRDRRVFHEWRDRDEDLELLRDEIQRLQTTEVQAFQDTLKFQRSEIAYLRALQIQNEILKRRVHELENSTVWRMFGPYRSLMARIRALAHPERPATGKNGAGENGAGR
jgi:SAM-dependent methyltransferase